MIGLDTHVLVRYIMQDDVKQAKSGKRRGGVAGGAPLSRQRR